MEERKKKTKVKGTEGETRWREGFGSPNNFGVTPHARPLAGFHGGQERPGHPRALGDAKCVTEILGGIRKLGRGQSLNLVN